MIQGGIWKLTLTPKQLVDGRFDFLMPSGAQINEETGFLVSESALYAYHSLNCQTTNYCSGIRCEYRYLCALFRARLCLLQPEQAGFGGAGCRYFCPVHPGADIQEKAEPQWRVHLSPESAALLMQYGIIRWKRFILIRSESKSLPNPGCQKNKSI